MSRHNRSKAEQARINGAKSRGPKTIEGRRRIALANRKHGLYATTSTVLDVESKEAFQVLRDAAFAQWRPRNAFEAQYVEEIADCSWRIARLRLCATHESNVSIARLREAAEHPLNWKDAVTKTELDGSTPQGAQTLLQRRVNALVMNRAMMSAELRALLGASMTGITQDLLQTQELPAGLSLGITHENPTEPTKEPGNSQ
jgi:hypothetical protein